MKKVLILNYHLIDGKAYSYNAFGGIYAVDLKDFERQLSVLKDFDVKVSSLNDVIDNKISDNFCVALTFDDGNPSDFDLVFPLLMKYGYTATFFLSTQNLEKNGVLWENYRQMKNQGFGIGSHGITHRDISNIYSSEAKIELQESKRIIESNINDSVRFFSVPFGRYNSNIIKLAKQVGYEAILSTQFNFVRPSEKPFVIHRWSIKRNTSIEEFKKIIQNHRYTVKKHIFVSALKKLFVSGFGSSFTNKAYTFKNKYFR